MLSCQDVDSTKEAQVLRTENLRVKDSIDKIQSIKEGLFLKDSVGIDFSKGALGRLYYSDTLVLSARFADCGEFGGHMEYLKIYSENDKYMCLYINKQVDCKKSFEDFERIDSTLFELSEYNQRNIVDYLSNLIEMSMLRQNLSNNYSNYYKLELYTEHTGEPYFIENPLMSLYFQDQSLKWSKFINLREEIKSNSRRLNN